MRSRPILASSRPRRSDVLGLNPLSRWLHFDDARNAPRSQRFALTLHCWSRLCGRVRCCRGYPVLAGAVRQRIRLVRSAVLPQPAIVIRHDAQPQLERCRPRAVPGTFSTTTQRSRRLRPHQESPRPACRPAARPHRIRSRRVRLTRR